MLRNIIITAMFLVVTSCEMIVDVEIPSEGPQLVVNSFFYPDSTWTVKLSRSRFILENEPNNNYYYENPQDEPEDPYIIENAEVKIFDGDELVEVLPYNKNGIYKSANKNPEVGRKYTLKVSAPGYNPVEAEDVVPEKIKIISASVKELPNTSEFFNSSYDTHSVSIKFKDPAGVKNYYMANMYGEHIYLDYEGKEFVDFQYMGFSSTDPSLVGSDWGSTFGNPLSFSDVLFDGKEGEIKVDFSGWWQEGEINLYIYLYHASAASHFFNLSVNTQYYLDGNPFAQPVPIRSNLSNGMGVFGGLNYDVYKVEFSANNW